MIKHTFNQLSESSKIKLNKADFKSLSKKEQEFLSMGATAFSGAGPVISPKNLHQLTPKGLSITLKNMEKEKRNFSSEEKKLLQSITKKLSTISEQFGGFMSSLPPKDEDEKEKMRRLAQQMAQRMGRDKQMPRLNPGDVRQLETGQPGAVSVDIGFENLARMRRKQPGPVDPREMKPEIPKMGNQPGMPPRHQQPMGQQPMGQQPMGQQPMGQQPMGQLGQRPPQGGGLPEMLKKLMASLGGYDGLSRGESKGPAEMKPEEGFSDRMKIDPIVRDAAQRYSDEPSAPKKPGPTKRNPQTSKGSQEFINKYSSQIKSFLNNILDKEKEKFQGGELGEQANSVGNGMSAVIPHQNPYLDGTDSPLFRRKKKKGDCGCKKCRCGK